MIFLVTSYSVVIQRMINIGIGYRFLRRVQIPTQPRLGSAYENSLMVFARSFMREMQGPKPELPPTRGSRVISYLDYRRLTIQHEDEKW